MPHRIYSERNEFRSTVFNVIHSEMKIPFGIVNVNQQLLKQVTRDRQTPASIGIRNKQITPGSTSGVGVTTYIYSASSGTMRPSIYRRKKLEFDMNSELAATFFSYSTCSFCIQFWLSEGGWGGEGGGFRLRQSGGGWLMGCCMWWKNLDIGKSPSCTLWVGWNVTFRNCIKCSWISFERCFVCCLRAENRLYINQSVQKILDILCC